MADTVSDRLWATFRALGADCVFGLPGTQTIDAFQALKRSGLRTVVPTHEMAAAFMANGYARASGRPGILTTIPGPGFTYALTGLAEAWLDSVPMVHVVPAARELPDREFALQAIDQRAMAGPIVKRIIRATRPDAVSLSVTEAFRAATAGEPGPVMLEIPEEVFPLDCAGGAAIAAAPAVADAAPGELDAIVRAIEGAPRILLFLGAGTLPCAESVRALVEAADAAVVNGLAQRADLVIALGCKFSHNGAAGFSLRLPRDKLLTINAHGPSNNYPARIHVTADCGAVVGRLVPRLARRTGGPAAWDRAELASLRDSALRFDRAMQIEPRLEGTDRPVRAIVEELRAALPDDAIVVTDSGLHQMSMRRYYAVRSPRGLIVPTNFQSMGYALPTAIGAAIAAPRRRVLAVVGDGGMIMSGLELLTAVREGIPLTVVVFNDAAYSLIRNAQLSGHGASHGTELMSPDFEALAAATGADYRRVGPDGLAAALAGADGAASPVRLVEVPLADSPGLRRMRLKGKVRAGVRRLWPQRHRGLLSRWRRR